MSNIVLAENLKLPAEFATQTACIFGKRGAGKSSTGVRLAEQLHAVGVPFAVLDPPDVWWGLKSSRDGKSPGIPVYVFGGRHADLPLEAGAGALLADVVVDHRINMVMSMRHFSIGERARLTIDFAGQLFKRNTEPLMLFCEEAHRLFPQSREEYGRGSRVEEMLGAMNKLLTEGRTSGIGLTAISQRPALVHATARNQAELLIAHRIIGPHDRDAIDGWIRYHHQDEEKRRDFLATLAHLKTGECWLWASEWPEERPIGLKRIQVLLPETYDSRRTPKPGEHLREPKALAPADLEKLRSKMAATIERAKAEDPKELRRRIAELEREVRVKPTPAPQGGINRDELSAAKIAANLRGYEEGALWAAGRYDRFLRGIKRQVEKAVFAVSDLIVLPTEVDKTIGWVAAEIEQCKPKEPQAEAVRRAVSSPPQAQVPRPALPVVPRQPRMAENNGKLPEGERAILTVAAQMNGVDRRQASILTGYRRSTRDAYISRLQGKGLLTIDGGKIVATAEGKVALGEYEELPTGRELAEWWLTRLPEGEAKILRILIDASGNAVDRESLDEATGYGRSTRDAYLSRMKAKQIIEVVGRGQVKASGELF